MKKLLIGLFLIASNSFAFNGLQLDTCFNFPGSQKKCNDVVQTLIFDRGWVLQQNNQIILDQFNIHHFH